MYLLVFLKRKVLCHKKNEHAQLIGNFTIAAVKW